MKLKDIKVCVEPDCEEIVDIKARTCPCCTSSQFMFLDGLWTLFNIRTLEKLRNEKEKAKLI